MCYSLSNIGWTPSTKMNSARSYAAAAQLQDGKLLVTGGADGSGSLNSAEMLTEEGWESNIRSLPVFIYAHCMVTVNTTTVMAIGGFQNGPVSGGTFYFTFGEETWTNGPLLNDKRGYHSCGRIRRNKDSQEMSIIVAGGWVGGSSYLSSVEILDEGSNEWRAGPGLPLNITASKMVEDQNGGVVLIGGFSSSFGLLSTLYQLQHGGQGANWSPMMQTLQIARSYHTAILVPDNSVNCSSI
jgi:hypothetical protein